MSIIVVPLQSGWMVTGTQDQARAEKAIAGIDPDFKPEDAVTGSHGWFRKIPSRRAGGFKIMVTKQQEKGRGRFEAVIMNGSALLLTPYRLELEERFAREGRRVKVRAA